MRLVSLVNIIAGVVKGVGLLLQTLMRLLNPEERTKLTFFHEEPLREWFDGKCVEEQPTALSESLRPSMGVSSTHQAENSSAVCKGCCFCFPRVLLSFPNAPLKPFSLNSQKPLKIKFCNRFWGCIFSPVKWLLCP